MLIFAAKWEVMNFGLASLCVTKGYNACCANDRADDKVIATFV